MRGFLAGSPLRDAQKALHEVVYVELPSTGSSTSKGEAIGAVESVKASVDIYSPLTGEIVEVNSELEEKPELINEDPYGKGWLVLIKPSNLSEELKELMTSEQYAEFLKEEIKKEGE
ncbi:MAG: glycine cleavage system protein GcvH [Thermoprotei archaeon]|nr:MAG: glycine cleavage system protein GcvH [Thermoprotei archaeon]